MRNDWLDKYEDGGEYLGTTNKGFNYNGAWGGQFEDGGSVYPVNYVPKAQIGINTLQPIMLPGINFVSDKISSWFGNDKKKPVVKEPIVKEPIVKNNTRTLNIVDPRKKMATTNQPLRPNSDLVGGKYSSIHLDKLMQEAKRQGLSKQDMMNLSAMGFQETKWGEYNIGHVLGNWKGNDSYQQFISAYKEKMKEADRLSFTDPAMRFQVYNGLGTITPKTEENYHGFKMQKIYGVPIPKGGISMKKNPLYGKQVIDVRDNVLAKNPEYLRYTDSIYKAPVPPLAMGGQFEEGGFLPQAQKGKIVEISDPKKFAYRDKMYNDSLSNYENSIIYNQKLKEIFKTKPNVTNDEYTKLTLPIEKYYPSNPALDIGIISKENLRLRDIITTINRRFKVTPWNFKKPVERVVLQKEPSLKKKVTKAELIKSDRTAFTPGLVGQQRPDIQIPPIQQGKYRVEYYDPSLRQETHRMFMTQAESNAYTNELLKRNLNGVPAVGNITQRVEYANGGSLPKAQKGITLRPIVINSKLNRAEKDSAILYNMGIAAQKQYKLNPNITTKQLYDIYDTPEANAAYVRLTKLNKKSPDRKQMGKPVPITDHNGMRDPVFIPFGYTKPVGTSKPKPEQEYPLVNKNIYKPKLKPGRITVPQMVTDEVDLPITQPRFPKGDYDYIFGPANSVIGRNYNGQFYSEDMPEQRGKVNQPDLDLLNNQEALKKYVQNKGLKFAMGGSLPGSVGFTYARTNSPAPSNGKYAKKTKASAQLGKNIKLTDKKSQEFYNKLEQYYTRPDATQVEKATYKAFQQLNEKHGYAPVGIKNKTIAGKRSMINPLTGRLNLVVPENEPVGEIKPEAKRMMEEYMNEYGHYQQYNEHPEYSKLRKAGNFLGDIAGDFGKMLQNVKGLRFKQAYNENYNTPGTTENEAHNIIQPRLQKELNENMLKNLESRLPQLQNGMEMKYYQDGLDWKPKSMEEGGLLNQYQDGGEEPLTKSSADWYKQWYEQRQALPQFSRVAGERLKLLSTLPKVQLTPLEELHKKGAVGEYIKDRGNDASQDIISLADPATVQAFAKKIGKSVDVNIGTDPSVVGHEMSHWFDARAKQSIFKPRGISKSEPYQRYPYIKPSMFKKSGLSSEDYKWITSEDVSQFGTQFGTGIKTEVNSVLNELRKKEGFRGDQPTTPEQLQKIIDKYMNLPESDLDGGTPKGSENQRIRTLIKYMGGDPEKLSELNNTIVAIEKEDVPIAKHGGWLNKFDEGGEISPNCDTNALYHPILNPCGYKPKLTPGLLVNTTQQTTQPYNSSNFRQQPLANSNSYIQEQQQQRFNNIQRGEKVNLKNQPQLKQAKRETPYERERRIALNSSYVGSNQYAALDDDGNITNRIAGIDITGKVYDSKAVRQERMKPLIAAGAIAAGATALPAVVSAAAPYVAATSAALNAPLLGTLGAQYGSAALTTNNLINAYFAYEGIKNIPKVVDDWKEVGKSPTWDNVGNATSSTLLSALGILPFTSGVTKGIPSVIQDFNQAGKYLTEETALKNAYKLNPFAENLNDPLKSYRVAGMDAARDFENTGVLRSVTPSTPEGATLLERAQNRPTSFPSFQKGYADMSYLPEEGGVIFETGLPTFKRGEINPVTGFPIRGRHYAHRVIDPITGATITEIPGENIRMFGDKPNWLKGYPEIPKQLPGSSNVNKVDNIAINLESQIAKLKEQEVLAEESRKILWGDYKAGNITAEEYTASAKKLNPSSGEKTNPRFELENQLRQHKVKQDIINVPQQNILQSEKQLGNNLVLSEPYYPKGTTLNTKGVFEVGDKYVARLSAHGYDDASLLVKYADKIKSPRIAKTLQVKEFNGKVYQVQQKATGTSMASLTEAELQNIPKKHIDNFWKDKAELEDLGLTIDISGGKPNILYDPKKGFQFIDLGISPIGKNMMSSNEIFAQTYKGLKLPGSSNAGITSNVDELVDLWRIQEKSGKTFAQLAEERKINPLFNNPATLARKAEEEKYFGQWFTKDKNDFDFYKADREFTNPEIINLKVPKSKLEQYSQYDKSLSRAPDREFVIPLEEQKLYKELPGSPNVVSSVDDVGNDVMDFNKDFGVAPMEYFSEYDKGLVTSKKFMDKSQDVFENLKSKHKEEFEKLYGTDYNEKDLLNYAKIKEQYFHPSETPLSSEKFSRLNNEFIEKFNPADIESINEKNALQAYTSGSYRGFNFRPNTDPNKTVLSLSGEHNPIFYKDEMSPSLQSAILKNKLNQHLALYRGIGDESVIPKVWRNNELLENIKFKDLIEGDEMLHEPFVSTSLFPNPHFGGFSSGTARIIAPKGQSYAFANKQGLSYTPSELELTLPQNLKFKITKKHSADEAFKLGYGVEQEIVNPYKEGGVIKDNMGYWNPENHGKVVEIDSPYITMEGVDQPLIGISDEGDQKYMLPGKNYKFKGKKVREYPVAKNGVRQEQKGLQNLDDLLNFTNYNKPQPGGWLNKYN